MSEKYIIIDFNGKELGECRTYLKNIIGYEQAIRDLKFYKAKQNQRISQLESRWEKLKQYIDILTNYDIDEANTAYKIIDKIEELENR